MPNIITFLCDATDPELSTPAVKAAWEQCTPFWDAVQATFSDAFVDEMLSVVLAAHHVEYQESFERGFRLGAQMGLALSGELQEKSPN